MKRPALAMVTLLAVLLVLLGWWGRGALSEDPDDHRLLNVTIDNQCHRHVRIFYGRHGPQRPQDISTLPAHASVSQLMMVGEVLWLLDDGNDELDRTTIVPGTATIGVLPSCVALRVEHREAG